MFKDWTLKDTKDVFLVVLLFFAILFLVSGFCFFIEINVLSRINLCCPQCGFDLIEGK